MMFRVPATLALSAVAALAASASAQTFTETTDAGSTLATAIDLAGFDAVAGTIDTSASDPLDLFLVQFEESALPVTLTLTPDGFSGELFILRESGDGLTSRDSTFTPNTNVITLELDTDQPVYVGVGSSNSRYLDTYSQAYFRIIGDDAVLFQDATNPNVGITGLFRNIALGGAIAADNGDQSIGSYTLTFTPVPEPTTLSFVGLGMAGLLVRRRR